MIKKFLYMFVVAGMLFSCANPELGPLLTFENSEKGAYPRLKQLIVGEYDLNDLTGSQYSYVIEFVDLEKGGLVQSFDIEVSYVDNNPGNGDQNKSAQTWKSYTQSDFTTNAEGFKEIAIDIPISAVSALLGLSPSDMQPGDLFLFNSILTTTEGAKYTYDNSSPAVRSSAFASWFRFDSKVTCPLEETEFAGTYEITYKDGVPPGGFGPILGATPGEFTLTTVDGSSTRRRLSWVYLPDSYSFGGQTFDIDFVCDMIVMNDSDTGVGCGGGSITIAQGAQTPFDITDDSSFEINIIDYDKDGGCGVAPVELTLVFTKK
ncbi:MAG: hypothetical protein KDE26_02975 [Bacteroidetes bacterium]|nr:hypothetical protein [Bacteroidota bacterium]MCB0842210.1 hypothetical protein [Bacteroidota bacterium]